MLSVLALFANYNVDEHDFHFNFKCFQDVLSNMSESTKQKTMQTLILTQQQYNSRDAVM